MSIKTTEGRLDKKGTHCKKIKELEELVDIFSAARAEHLKIAHCHGVFDLLHVGHIRHFEQAKSAADILVVTITPDRFVDKGPHRPAFPEGLRAEAIAALGCVDYVAINKWPMATEVIQLLKPNFYVKGPDYKEAEKDHTGGILLEESAVQEVGGQLVFTDDITFSASSLINKHLPLFPKGVSDYLANFSQRYSSNDILGFINNSKSLNVLVVGEAIIDEYQYCEAIGKSSKEPMLAIKRLSTEKFVGGVLAVANHVANFCGRVGLLTMLGSEHSQEDFIRENLGSCIGEKIFLYRKSAPTIVKRRFVESYFFTKMMELYEINDSVMDPEDNRILCQTLEKEVPKYDVVIVADFGHGMFTQEAINILYDKAKFLAVNAQTNAGNVGYQSIQKYRRADFISMAEHEIRMESRDRRGELKKMILDLSNKIDCHQIAVTRGKSGCICYSMTEGFFEVPAFAGQVLDRMGAGDAFFSLTSLAVAQKVPMEVVGFIGNTVGAQAVATIGHRRFIERAPLFKHIESLLK